MPDLFKQFSNLRASTFMPIVIPNSYIYFKRNKSAGHRSCLNRKKELEMKLFHKFTLGFILIVLISSLTGYFSIMQSKKILNAAFTNNAEILALEMMNGLDREFKKIIFGFDGYANNVLVQKNIISSNREFDKLGNIQTYINNRDKEWISSNREKIPPFIQDISNNDLSGELKEKLEFYEHSYGYKVIGELFITNKYGANIAQTGITSDYRQDDEDWWQLTKNDDLYIGNIKYDKSTDMQSISFGIRIEDKNYNFLGVMKVVMNLDYIYRFFEEMDPPGAHKQHNKMAYRIITDDGKSIYSSKGDYKFLEYIPDILPKDHLMSEGDHNLVSTMMFSRQEKEHDILVIHVHAKGDTVIKRLKWILIIEEDAEELFAPALKLKNQILTVTLIVSIISILMGFIISGSITKKIRKLKNIIARLGRGDLDVDVDIESRDELGELARTFKHMAEDLKTTTVNRDELVEEIERRKLAETATYDNEERFRSVAENASDAIIYINEYGEIIFWNHASENIFGYPAEEVVGQSINLLIPERFHQAHSEGMLRVIKYGKSKLAGKSVELTATRKDGTEFPIELSISSWKIGKDVYFTGIIRNISERKHSEDVIKEQVGRLSALRSIDKAIIGSLDLSVTLDVFLTQVKSQLDIDAVSVLLLNQNTQTLEYVESKGFRSNALKYTKLRLGESNAGQAALGRSIVSIPNLKENVDGFTNSKEFSSEAFVSYYAVPLIAKGQVKGVLELFNRTYLNSRNGWMEFLEAIADQGAIALDNSTMFDDLQRSNVELSLAYDTTIEGWAHALDLRDKETEGHSRRVTELSVRIADEFKMSDEEIIQIRRGALLHDIGKMGIPDSILLKPGKLTEEERNIMMQHPIHARNLLYPIEYLRPALDIPYYHHERWDGTGYPDGLKGEKIPLSARIFAVIDVWDALRSDRPYRPAWPIEKVKEHIRHQVGTHFDAGVIEVFLSMDLY